MIKDDNDNEIGHICFIPTVNGHLWQCKVQKKGDFYVLDDDCIDEISDKDSILKECKILEQEKNYETDSEIIKKLLGSTLTINNKFYHFIRFFQIIIYFSNN